MGFHAQALVRTDTPARYAAELARELGREYEAEWSAEAGSIKLPDGVCDMHSWPEGLRLDAFADSAAGLTRIEQTVQRQLARADDRLVVEWYLRPNA
jgi:hypothetical protein